MIDLLNEATISLAEACRLLPTGRNGARPHISCLLRWVLNGSRGPSGTLVRLDAVRLGGRWLTSKEALNRFAAALTPHLGTEPAPAVRPPSKRQRQAELAQQELQEQGM